MLLAIISAGIVITTIAAATTAMGAVFQTVEAITMGAEIIGAVTMAVTATVGITIIMAAAKTTTPAGPIHIGWTIGSPSPLFRIIITPFRLFHILTILITSRP
ncbi:MAG: hypothetical protein ABSF56_00315 [Minisyncoccia bacterium]|jgi:hypothetical protein